nr:Chain E, Tumor necrosis factor receptor superfamily member 16 [synthetic construct]
ATLDALLAALRRIQRAD